MAFSSQVFSAGTFWTILTYPWFHNIVSSNIWFAIEMLMFFWFGREVERFIGRNAFLWFYSLLVILPPIVMGIVSALSGARFVMAGSSQIHFAVFIGFVTIYPNAVFFLRIVAKWLALVFLGVYSLMYLAANAWMALLQLWITTGTAWVTLKYAGVSGGLGVAHWMENFKAEQDEKRMTQHRRRHEENERVREESVDVILDKIKEHGIESLSDEERAILNATSQRLSNRDKFSK
jgi:hypothetical protein